MTPATDEPPARHAPARWPGSAPRSGAAILRDLKRVQVLGGALYVAAHPDDENTKLLATLANETQVRTAYLAFTRGEGGQNLIGQELGPLLGLIRTQELLAARRIDGAEQFFTRAADFGFSKSVDETLARWDHEAVLTDAVRVVRAVRPDVIITRFSPEPSDTHGHHTASAKLAVEAFKAAADPGFHPEAGQPWAAKRIVWNAWSFDNAANAKLEAQSAFHMDSSPYSALLGQTYGELAADSRSMHKSQGFGAAPVHGPSPESFILLDGAPGRSLFDGVELTWNRVGQPMPLLDKAVREFKVDKPAASIPTLLQALEALRKQPEHPFKAQKIDELVNVIADCAGLFVEATSPVYSVVPGAELEVNVTVLSRAAELKPKNPAPKLTLRAPTEALPADPTSPEPPYPFWVDVAFDAFTLRRPVVYKWTDPTVGERYRRVEVLPKVLLKPDTSLLVFADGSAKPLKVTVTANADGEAGELKPEVPAGWSVTGSGAYALAKKGDTAELVFQVKPGKGSGALKLGGQTLTRIDYPHIPIQTRLTPADVELTRIELSRAKVAHVGYIPGAGDEVPQALRQVGYDVTLLDDETLRSRPLKFDAIVVGIRAFNVNPKLPAVYGRLMQYVNDGGTLLVQYNTKNRVSDVPAQIGPYPFDISRDRVTDERAQVTLDGKLGGPNALTSADFEGWVQERGLYFAGTWDPKYETPLSMHDPNEPPKKGSLLIARYGKGTFIYTGLAFFRQLPAGVPGAYRLFANLLAHGH